MYVFSDSQLWFVNCREKYDGRNVGFYKTWCFLFTNLLKVPFCNSFSIRLLTFFFLKWYINSDSKWMFLYKWPLKDYLWPIFAICMFIFHKTEVLKVILRCWTGLDYDWCKSYDKKCKYFHFFFFCNFVEKHMLAVFVFFAFLCFMS